MCDQKTEFKELHSCFVTDTENHSSVKTREAGVISVD